MHSSLLFSDRCSKRRRSNEGVINENTLEALRIWYAKYCRHETSSTPCDRAADYLLIGHNLHTIYSTKTVQYDWFVFLILNGHLSPSCIADYLAVGYISKETATNLKLETHVQSKEILKHISTTL